MRERENYIITRYSSLTTNVFKFEIVIDEDMLMFLTSFFSLNIDINMHVCFSNYSHLTFDCFCYIVEHDILIKIIIIIALSSENGRHIVVYLRN